MSTAAKVQLISSGRSFSPSRRSYLRPVEFLAIATLILSLSLVMYLLFGLLVDRDQRIELLKSESADLKKQIQDVKARNSRKLIIKTSTDTAIVNLEEFNNRFLKDQLQGRLALIDEINKLVRDNGLTLLSGISFRQIEDIDLVEAREQKDKQSGEKKRIRRSTKSDGVDVFPGIRASFSVGGQYSGLRSFLYDLESNKMFIIVEQISLGSGQTIDSRGRARVQPQQQSIASDEGTGISIQFEIKAHFRKQGNIQSIANGTATGK